MTIIVFGYPFLYLKVGRKKKILSAKMYHLCFKYQIAEIPEITHDIFIAEKFAYICTGVISPPPLVWGAGNPLIED